MDCPRCDGVMVRDAFEDMQDDTGTLSFYGWRCITCGEIVDPLILSNREGKHSPLIGRARKKFATQVG